MHHSHLGSHDLIDDPAEADLILFAEVYDGLDSYCFDIVCHPVFRRFPNKCVLYHVNDTTETLCRTVSPSVESTHLNARSRRSFSYVVRVHENPFRSENWDRERPAKFLFSFAGDPGTHPIRRQILGLQLPEALLRSAAGTSNGEDCIATLCTSDLSEFNLASTGAVLATNGQPVSIVHQNDWHQSLAKKTHGGSVLGHMIFMPLGDESCT